jgi:hypothetical protein
MGEEITEEEIKGILLEVIGIVNEARLKKDIRDTYIEDAIFHLQVLQREIDFSKIAEKGYS